MTNKILKRRRKVPKFPRQDAHKKIKLKGKSWRKPKGRHGRVKRLHDYHGASPKIGHGTPLEFKHLHSSGLAVLEVSNLKDLSTLDEKSYVIKIRNVGKKKKLDLIKEAMKKNIKISNVRKPEVWIKDNEKPAKKGAKK